MATKRKKYKLKPKPLKFLITQKIDGTFYYSVLAPNGRNLSPQDPQNRKATVSRAISVLVNKVQNGNFVIEFVKDSDKL